MARQLRRSMAGTGAAQQARKPVARPAVQPDLGRRGRGLGEFIREVRSELRKVVWPTPEQAARLTALVVALSVAMGLVLGFIDFVFAELFRAIVR